MIKGHNLIQTSFIGLKKDLRTDVGFTTLVVFKKSDFIKFVIELNSEIF